MKNTEKDIHLGKLLTKLEYKERLLKSFPSEDLFNDEEMEFRDLLAIEIFDLRLEIKNWWVKLKKEENIGEI